MTKSFVKVVAGIVVNTAVAEDEWPFPNDPYIEVTGNLPVEPGWSYSNGVFIDERPRCDPQQFPATPLVSKVTPLQFFDRFTESEQLAVVTATMQVPAVKLWYDKLIAATEVVESDPRVAVGLNALVAAGLITQARSEVILPLAKRSTGVQTI